jgi:hypothetical protein
MQTANRLGNTRLCNEPQLRRDATLTEWVHDSFGRIDGACVLSMNCPGTTIHANLGWSAIIGRPIVFTFTSPSFSDLTGPNKCQNASQVEPPSRAPVHMHLKYEFQTQKRAPFTHMRSPGKHTLVARSSLALAGCCLSLKKRVSLTILSLFHLPNHTIFKTRQLFPPHG